MVEHRVDRHLEGDLHLASVDDPMRDRSRHPPASAVAGDHEFVVPETELGSVRLHVVDRVEAVVESCGKRVSGQRQPVGGSHDRHVAPLDQVFEEVMCLLRDPHLVAAAMCVHHPGKGVCHIGRLVYASTNQCPGVVVLGMRISSLTMPSISLPTSGRMAKRCIMRRPQLRRAIQLRAPPGVRLRRSSWW